MKRWWVLVGVIMGLYLFMGGCSVKNRVQNDGLAKEDIKKIQAVTKEQVLAIKNKDLIAYLNTLDQSQPEYIAERKNWFADLSNHAITNFHISILRVDKINSSKYNAIIHQSYDFKGEKYEATFKSRFISQRGRWVDSDLAFSKMETKHFIIKYLEGAKEEAEVAALGAEEALMMVLDRTGITPKGRTIVKLYKDKEVLRQSVKLSFPWQFAGWYEYPESIKSLSYNDKNRYREVIAHELIHKLTITSSNNNLPYWLSEGLAMYYTEFYRETGALDKAVEDKGLLSIEALEQINLEAIKDPSTIRNYYVSSGRIVQFIAETYGEDQLISLVNKLGQYAYVEGTGIEVDAISLKRFHEILPHVLGLTAEELDVKWQEFKK